MSFITKLDKLQPAIQRFRNSGGDIRLIAQDVSDIERLVQMADFAAAEKKLTQLLSRLRRESLRETG